MRAERVRELLLDALVVNGGWLPRTPLKSFAFGGEQVWSDQITEALTALEGEGLIEIAARHRKRGRREDRAAEVTFYRATGTGTTVADPTLAYAQLMTTLAPSDRLALLDFAHVQAELEVAEGRPGVWLRISTALAGAERDATRQAVDSSDANDKAAP